MFLGFLAVLGAADAAPPQSLAGESSPPTAEAQSEPDEATEVAPVEVTGQRPEVVSRIDREVYSVRDNPAAQSGPVLDVLGTLPSVTVTPNGRVLLLGSPGVTILIDGKAPPNVDAALRALPGSDVDRIEVMTNPSAQNRPDGTAGIINIITRRQRAAGVSGGASASVDTLGSARASISPTLSRGRWTVSGSLSATRDVTRAERRATFVELDATGTPILSSEEEAQTRSETDNISASLKLAYKPTDSETLSLSLQGFDASGSGRTVIHSDASDPTFSFDEYSEGPGRIRGGVASLDYAREDPDTGATFGITAGVTRSTFEVENRFRHVPTPVAGVPTLYRTGAFFDIEDYELRIEYERPFEGDRLWSFGGELTQTNRRITDFLVTESGPSGIGPDFDRSIFGRRDIVAGYSTYQFSWGEWTVLPGLRVEIEQLTVRSSGVAGETEGASVFPSLHVSRPVGANGNIRLSYSRRIDRPDLQQLNPALQYTSTLEASQGNPGLDPVTTDAFEARFNYAKDEREVTVTLYARESFDNWTEFSRLTSDGVRVTSPINAGDAGNRGAEFSVRSPISTRWRFALTANLYWSSYSVLDGGRFDTETLFTYSGNWQLEFRENPAKPTEGDQFQISVRYLGPQPSLQGSTSGFYRVDLTYRRPITDRLAFVITATDVFDSSDTRTEIRAQDYLEDERFRGSGPAIRLSLNYRLGSQR